MLPDNHNHYIAWGDPAAMVEAAAAAGVTELVFSEHVHHIEEARAASPYIATRFAPEGPPVAHGGYVATVRAAAAVAPIPVRCGIELDVADDNAGLVAATNALRDSYASEWDVVIGSVHVIGGDAAIEGEPVHSDARPPGPTTSSGSPRRPRPATTTSSRIRCASRSRIPTRRRSWQRVSVTWRRPPPGPTWRSR